MVGSSILVAVAALVLYGAWAVTAGVATRSVTPLNAVFVSYVAGIAVVGAYVLFTRRPVTGSRVDLAFAAVSGVCLAAGTVGFYAALARGSMPVVSAIVALYFVIPAVVGVLYFDAALSATNVAGLALAVAAVVLVAS
ncbi:EamA family transporter [Halobacterium sp. R2-5]|uniref:EamA family transporter n=1 Tax=Halobacterium sp. R2-5 TaxID=2715751 RepID=UPI00142478C7|nr:EamA family transporter [Halobacterium sp. R2-5]NIB98002.1 EamA family transporter [Halobacterium sp. R2-5]